MSDPRDRWREWVTQYQSKVLKMRVGEFWITPCATPGKVWLENGIGEGMQTDEAKLAQHLAEYFQREF